jgi:DNA-binding transcriptional ArsR family regulator
MSRRRSHEGKYLSEPLTIHQSQYILKHMLNNVSDLDSVFHALADPGRRLMLERLGQGPASVSELGKSLPMTLAAVVQHVQVLEASGLVQTQKLGRTRMCTLNPGPLRSAERWISERRAFVERSLDRLGQYLAETIETTDPATNAGRPGLHPSEEETS